MVCPRKAVRWRARAEVGEGEGFAGSEEEKPWGGEERRGEEGGEKEEKEEENPEGEEESGEVGELGTEEKDFRRERTTFSLPNQQATSNGQNPR